MNGILQTAAGVWVVENDSHLTKWVTEQNRLDVDRTANAFAKKYLRPGDVVIDAGAAIGDTATAFAKVVGPTGRVIAFEPHPLMYECLVRNCPGVECHPLALGARFGVHGSQLDPGQPQNFGMNWIDLACETKQGTVFVSDLDGVLNLSRLDLLKIDVEGMEWEVLLGAQKTIARCRPLLYVELNPHTLFRRGLTVPLLVSKIEALGYQLQFLAPDHHLALPQLDVLFIPA